MNHSGQGRIGLLALAAVCGLGLAGTASADEGMWLLTRPPVEELKSKYQFEPSPAWMEHMQKSAVRFQVGGSGSIVSADGLVMTNHHIGSDALQKLSTPGHDLLQSGFCAASREQELKCPDLELNVLWSIEDVTDRVTSAAKPEMTPAQAGEARRKAIATIEAESQKATGLKSEVVTLYHGARYHLYRYRRYTDVRLVMAPDQQAAFFGGDTDNFEFPRYDLDMCFFRIYENGRPLHPEHYLSWSPAGSKEGDLALVFGHPGRTERLFTVDHLKFLRDVQIPASLRYLWREEVKLQTFGGRSVANERASHEDFLEVANSRKAYTGQIAGLMDPALIARKGREQARYKAAAQTAEDNADPWQRIGQSLGEYKRFYVRNYAVNRVFGGDLFKIGQDLVRMAEELPKPSSERLREYNDANLESTELRVYSPAPVQDDVEIAKLEWSLAFLVENFGGDDPLVIRALDGKSPRERAEEVVRGTKLKDVEARRALAKGGERAVEASDDPLIVLARAIDPEARALRKAFEDRIEPVQRDAYAQIAAAQFKAEGENAYPDATFTLRMAFGPVKGYEENGRHVAAYTTMAGLYERAAERKDSPDFAIDERWVKAKGSLDLSTPMNFVCTADIIGGNSGSPVVNTQGQVIGLIFDGNIQSLPWAFEYSDVQGRATAVDSRAIVEALRKVYGAGALADELMGGKGAAGK